MANDNQDQPFISMTDPDFLELIRTALYTNGYHAKERESFESVGTDRTYLVDFVTKNKSGYPLFIKLQFQEVAGTTEHKVPFKAIRLIHTVRETNLGTGRDADEGAHAYLVLGGEGWTLREFFTSGLCHHLADGSCVTVCTVGDFIKRVQRGNL